MIKYIFPVTAVITVIALIILIFCLPTPSTGQTHNMHVVQASNAYV